ncbi:LutC/YkgG family protein [Paeniglutamicibacter gangotriensis]|uniref:Lactate catabolic enzyme n=2 Tax=Paeniglutamicibacter gangotriensis TaxID=254787 RepID=M7MUN1_9MICC|nr:LUD domain-containing protein [Paeniglutamicibacter gangotriensis]EMQ98731.1 lactate catabolic enzyme [Paeniglutamicibacter gangotriensis Lz1y]KAA0976035.1 lactate utilization protein C [Paeniglutamicibacter gangotriensis]
MSAKEEILSRITSALRDAPAPEPIPREYRVSSDMPEAELIELLVDRLEDYKAHVDVVDLPHLPATLAERLKDATSFVVPHGIDAEWLVEAAPTDSARLRTDAPGAVLSVTELDHTDAVLTSSAVSIAESGTIVLDGTPNQGRRAISLVPDHHVCVVPVSSIVRLLPEALPRMDITRPLTWISGPSATSDIELERVEGVHGPRQLDVIIVKGL